jgi:hypothetical protein
VIRRLLADIAAHPFTMGAFVAGMVILGLK